MIEQIFLTIGELKASVSALTRLSAIDMPVKAAYRISSTLNRVEDELKKHNLAVSELIKKNNGTVELNGDVLFLPLSPRTILDRLAAI